MQPLSSSRSSFVTLLLRGMRSTDRFFFFRSQASLRFTSCGHECCLVRSLGGCGALWRDIVVVRSFILYGPLLICKTSLSTQKETVYFEYNASNCFLLKFGGCFCIHKDKILRYIILLNVSTVSLDICYH